jgi:hypothetical protein
MDDLTDAIPGQSLKNEKAEQFGEKHERSGTRVGRNRASLVKVTTFRRSCQWGLFKSNRPTVSARGGTCGPAPELLQRVFRQDRRAMPSRSAGIRRTEQNGSEPQRSEGRTPTGVKVLVAVPDEGPHSVRQQYGRLPNLAGIAFIAGLAVRAGEDQFADKCPFANDADCRQMPRNVVNSLKGGT